MIARYTLPQMGGIWTEENRFQRMLDVEVAACRALVQLKKIPARDYQVIKKKAGFSVDEIHRIEKTTKHDVTAFLASVGRRVGPSARFIHKGLTSSDVLDTGLALQMVESLNLVLEDQQVFLKSLKKKALRHKNTLMIGRSHGVHAEPVTFGLKMALFYEEGKRNLERLKAARENIRVGKLSGAVGTFANIDPNVEKLVCKFLSLKIDPVSTQIIQRDRHAQVLTALAITAGSLDKLATEIRHLQRTEVLEAEEAFSEGQTGSSAMPHKRNPVTCEKITGLARVVKSNSLPALENITLWHERDISHSSVERVILPDSFILVDYMIQTMTEVIRDLIVYPDHMLANLNKTRGLIFSQRVLLSLMDKGMSRDGAYKIVQRHSMKVWKNKVLDLKTELKKDKQVIHRLTPREIDKIFDWRYHTKHVDLIFKRVFRS